MSKKKSKIFKGDLELKKILNAKKYLMKTTALERKRTFGVKDVLYKEDRVAELNRDKAIYKDVVKAFNQPQNLKRDEIVKKNIFGKKKTKLGPKKDIQGTSVIDVVKTVKKQKEGKDWFRKHHGDYEKAAEKVVREANNTYKEGK